MVVANELEAAKKKYKEAYEAGDADGIVAAQEEITVAKIKAERVNNFKPAPLQPQETEVKTEPQSFKQQSKVDPKVAAWHEANPWFGTNDEMTAVALTVHKKLVENGIDTNSEHYFNSINNRMRQIFPDAFPSEKTCEAIFASSTGNPKHRAQENRAYEIPSQHCQASWSYE